VDSVDEESALVGGHGFVEPSRWPAVLSETIIFKCTLFPNTLVSETGQACKVGKNRRINDYYLTSTVHFPKCVAIQLDFVSF
jgi:hypothetical protein